MDNLINNDPYEVEGKEFRTIDGTNNNLGNFLYGSTGSNLLNIVPLDYGDGISSSAGQNRLNPREISNAIAQQDEIINSDRGLTNFSWAFGQFVDHDIVLTPENSEVEVNIQVPQGDPFLDSEGTGRVAIPLDSTAFAEGTGTDLNNPAQIPNNITAWLDGSNIYGSDNDRNVYLREFSGGLLKVSQGNLLPFGNESIDNANPSRQDSNSLFVAGDVRANENSVLVSVHTLFVREHNRIALELSAAHPDWTDEQLYQRAREINIAQYQAIVYNEYLPSLLGVDALPEYSGYDSTINPNIRRSFSSAGFRIGHTQLSSDILRLDILGESIPEGNLTLSEVFFRSTNIIQETGIDPILRGISSSLSQNVDTKLIDDVRNLLFTFGPHTSGRDLFAINIQRGRINGVNDYNTVREFYGLEQVDSFAEITSNSELQTELASIYGSVDNIDPYVGLLSEDHIPGAAVGETVQGILLEQFLALREGDRFYYENIFTNAEITEIEDVTLSDIIRRNTDTTIIQDNAFTLLNEGTAADEMLRGGLGNDTIFGGDGDDLIVAFQGDDFLSGGAGNDILLGLEGKDTIEGGLGDDAYQLNLNTAGGSKINDSGGFDYLLIDSDDIDLDNVDLEYPDSFNSSEIALSKPTEGIVGLKKSGTNLIIDLNRDGVASIQDDLTIYDFFDTNGEAGQGAIEGINNLSSTDIIDYIQINNAIATPFGTGTIQNNDQLVGISIDETNNAIDGMAYDAHSADDNNINTTLSDDLLNLGTDADFDNLVGFYEIVDMNGGIDTNGDGVNDLMPEDDDYARAAIVNRITNWELRAGSSGDTNKNTTAEQFGNLIIAGDKMYAPFVIVNAGEMGFEGFIDAEDGETDGEFNEAATNIDDMVTYFAFRGANPDGAVHLEARGNNTFGFEDLPANLGVSDNDFNDAIFKFDFSFV